MRGSTLNISLLLASQFPGPLLDSGSLAQKVQFLDWGTCSLDQSFSPTPMACQGQKENLGPQEAFPTVSSQKQGTGV